MSSLISCRSLAMSYGPKQLFSDLSLSIAPSDRIGLVGPNGVGKSTLLRILAGLEDSESGQLLKSRGLKLGYFAQGLAQEDCNVTVARFLEESSGQLHSIEKELFVLEEQMSQAQISPGELTELMERYSDLQELFERRGGYDSAYRIQEVLDGLGLTCLSVERSVSSLSGGQRSRLALAALLLEQADVLLLDEPTNHLDINALEWLETYLANYPHGVLLVSHDRRFLDRTCTDIIELIPEEGARRFGGAYSDYLQYKERIQEQAERDYQNYLAERSRLRQTLRSASFSKRAPGPMRDNNKMAYDKRGSRAQQDESRKIAKLKISLQDLEENPVKKPVSPASLHLRFQESELAADCVLALRDLSFSYAEHALFSGLNKEVYSKDKICIRGANGAGKSTLLKLIEGRLKASSGEVIWAPGVKIGSLTQDLDFLSPSSTLKEAFEQLGCSEIEEQSALLASVGLLDCVYSKQRLRELSWGQVQRFQLAAVIAARPNVLLLDEPTNHLDLHTIEHFQAALMEFNGVLLCATHDRWLMDCFELHWTLS